LFEQRLDRSRPLWRIDLIGPLVGGGCALMWRLHHAMGDGTTSSRLAGELLWDRSESPQTDQRRAPTVESRARRTGLAGLVWREFAPTPFRSPFDGEISARRRVAFASVALGPLRQAAHECAGATVNDAVLSITAGALRRWLLARGQPVHNLRVKVPVSLHDEGDRLANRDSFFSLVLPIEQPDPLQRLRAVHAATRLRKGRHDAQVLDDITRRLAGAQSASDVGLRLPTGPKAFALNVSNVHGPARPVSVLGVPVRSIHSLAEIRQRHALRIAVISYADQLNIGLCAEPHIVPDLTALSAAMQADAAEMLTAARR
jgi:WS/DGAT/MGAT family acyltransferase